MLGVLRKTSRAEGLERRFALDDLFQQVQYLKNTYPLGLQQSMVPKEVEEVDQSFSGFAQVYRETGPVFACMLARTTLFSEVRFQFQRMSDGRPANLFGNRSLRILEEPWPGQTTGSFTNLAETDVQLAGNWFFHKLDENRARRLRPDWTSILIGSNMDVDYPAEAIDAHVVAYAYEPPNGPRQFLLPESVCHWAPIPDPLANYRGMSWIPAAFEDVKTDTKAIRHRGQFFDNSATSNFVVLPDKEVGREEFKDFRDDFAENYEGVVNAYRTIFVGGGSDIRVIGLDFEKMDMRNLQGAGETRIAAASRVPPIVAGFSEGLAAATYSNYGQARRAFGDGWARPEWRSICGALGSLVRAPRASRLWYDDRDIPFLREDLGDEAEIRNKDAATVSSLIVAGYDPDAAVEFVSTSNLAALKGQHTGAVPVQLAEVDGDTDNEEESEAPSEPEDTDNEETSEDRG